MSNSMNSRQNAWSNIIRRISVIRFIMLLFPFHCNPFKDWSAIFVYAYMQLRKRR